MVRRVNDCRHISHPSLHLSRPVSFFWKLHFEGPDLKFAYANKAKTKILALASRVNLACKMAPVSEVARES